MLKQLVKDTHCMPIRPHILRVVALKESGVAILQGSDDATANHHASKLSQCLLPMLDTRVYLGKYVRTDAVHCLYAAASEAHR